jgi:hypothetical protein
VQKVSQKLIVRIGEEAAHSLQKNKFLVITFEWKICFGSIFFFHVLYSFLHLH